MMKVFKIHGSSINHVFVKCYICRNKFSWLNCYESEKDGLYIAKCRTCRLLKARRS